MEGVGAPDRVITLREHAWKYEPSEIHVKRGEVVQIDFSATDNGLGAGHGFALDGLDQSVFINGAMVGAPLSVTFKVDDARPLQLLLRDAVQHHRAAPARCTAC